MLRDFRIMRDVTGNEKSLAETDNTYRLSRVLVTIKAFYGTAYVALFTPDYELVLSDYRRRHFMRNIEDGGQ